MSSTAEEGFIIATRRYDFPRRTPIPSRAVGWCPFEHRRPRTDDEYFEALTAAVFAARFNPEVVRKRWPAIRLAFADFSLREVAGWNEDALESLMNAPGIIRSPKKILAPSLPFFVRCVRA